jgi:dTDP-4-dehydrorhamnose reductase
VHLNQPKYIINCAAYTAVDKAEEQLELARKVNAIGPKNLAIVANEENATLIHISTDYVFGGAKNVEEDYTEMEDKSPESVYGITKLEGEQAIIDSCFQYYIFRTAWLYGDGNNFVRTMLKLGKEKEQINVVMDQHGSPTYAVDLASIIHQAIKKQIPYGIYHATDLGYTTWYEFTKEIFAKANITCKVNPVTSEEFASVAKRPKNSKLSKEKLLKEGIEIPTYEDALNRYLKEELK